MVESKWKVKGGAQFAGRGPQLGVYVQIVDGEK